MTREEFEQYAKEQGLVVWSKEMSDKAINALTAIEDIKQEIIQERDGDMGGDESMIDSFKYGCNMALEIIDKHIGEVRE